MERSAVRDARRDIKYGILNRTFGELGKTLADPNVVFSLFVRQLGASNILVGLLSTIRYAGWFLPQVLVGGYLQHQVRRGRLYLLGEGARCFGYLLLGLMILTVSDARILLPGFYVVFALAYLGHGTGAVPRFDVIGRALPVHQRSSFFARANLVAGILGFGAGFIVQAMLRSGAGTSGVPVQRYAWLILLSVGFYGLAIASFRRIQEHESSRKEGRPSILKTLRTIPSVLASDGNYRQLVSALVLTDAARRIADPFYILFATEVLGVPIYFAGIYLSVTVLAKILSNLLWDLLSRTLGNRRILQLSSAASLAVPVATFLFAVFAMPGAPRNGPAFALVFALMGVRDSGKHIGKRSVFLDIVSEEDRPLHWGTLNSVLGIVSLLPLLAGTLIDRVGYAVTFALVSLVAACGLWISLRIRAIPKEGFPV